MRTKYIVSAIRFALVSREYHREAAARQKRIAEVWNRIGDAAEPVKHHGRFA